MRFPFLVALVCTRARSEVQDAFKAESEREVQRTMNPEDAFEAEFEREAQRTMHPRVRRRPHGTVDVSLAREEQHSMEPEARWKLRAQRAAHAREEQRTEPVARPRHFLQPRQAMRSSQSSENVVDQEARPSRSAKQSRPRHKANTRRIASAVCAAPRRKCRIQFLTRDTAEPTAFCWNAGKECSPDMRPMRPTGGLVCGRLSVERLICWLPLEAVSGTPGVCYSLNHASTGHHQWLQQEPSGCGSVMTDEMIKDHQRALKRRAQLKSEGDTGETRESRAQDAETAARRWSHAEQAVKMQHRKVKRVKSVVRNDSLTLFRHRPTIEEGKRSPALRHASRLTATPRDTMPHQDMSSHATSIHAEKEAGQLLEEVAPPPLASMVSAALKHGTSRVRTREKMGNVSKTRLGQTRAKWKPIVTYRGGDAYLISDAGQNGCHLGWAHVVDVNACRAAAHVLGMPAHAQDNIFIYSDDHTQPNGCFKSGKYATVHFNTLNSSAPAGPIRGAPVCHRPTMRKATIG